MKKLTFLIILSFCWITLIHSQTWNELNKKAEEYYSKGVYITAIECAEKAKERAEVEFGKEHENYATSINYLAVLYHKMGNYSKAETLFIEALNIRKKVLGTFHPDYATSLNDLAELYHDLGNYSKADSLYIEALNIRKKMLGTFHPDYATSLNDLAELYQDMGNYSKADSLFIEALNIRTKVLGTGHPDYATSLNDLAELYQDMGNYSKADSLYIEALNIRKKVLGNDHPDYATSLDNLATLYGDMGNYSKAEPLFIEALNIRKKTLGTNHLDYAISLNNLASLYHYMGLYSKAEPLYIEALNIDKRFLGTDHPSYATDIDNLAVLYVDMGNYSKAEPLYIEALNIREKALGTDHPFYVTSLNNLAGLYNEIGNYSKAEQLYIEALNISKKVLGKNHPDYPQTLNNLAGLYIDMGNYSKAEPLFIEALNINKKALGPDHPHYVASLNSLARLYDIMGNYSKAESLFTEALNTTKRVLGTDHPDYVTVLENLAGLYAVLGNYSKAEPLYIEALNTTKKVLGSVHPEYATSLNDLASLYQDMGNYSKAEPLYIEALNIRKKVLGTDHPVYAQSLNNLASLYDDMGNYSKAELLFTEDLNICKKTLGTDHPGYAISLNNLASLYQDMGNYSKAEPLYIEALNIRKKVLGTDHPVYAQSLNNLASLYDDMDNYSKAESLFLQANVNLNNQIDKNFAFLSEKEKEQFLDNSINFIFDIYNSFFLKRKEQNPSVIAVSYNNELAHKGMLLLSNTALFQYVYSSNDSMLIEIYDRFIANHKMLSKLYTTPIAERTKNIDSLENEAEKLEKELVSKGTNMPSFENIMGLSKIKWQDVQQALKPGEAAIEFVNFHLYEKRWTDSTFYCALVLLKNSIYPKMIYLFEEKQLQEILSAPQATYNDNYIKQLYSYKPNMPSLNNQSATQNILYRLIWQPFDSLLKGIDTIYIAPSGLLNKVAFNAIPINASVYLSDKYSLNLVSSTRVLTQAYKSELPSSSNFKVALYGGIDYDLDSAEMIASVKQYQKPQYYLLASRSFSIPESVKGLTWTYLPGTLTEISVIEKLCKSKQIKSVLFKGKDATEESFMHLNDSGKSPEIIHIATHGFFFPEVKPKNIELEKVIFKSYSRSDISNEPVFEHAENPLLRSGILLAGANRIWNNLPEIEGVEDGTLTAHEVSSMRLSNTQLVVLSACETGLGEVKGDEGVFGLQRAFKIAGVKYIIMSLWQVPDYQTSELMKLFYTNWLNGMSLKDAFSTAQQTMRKKYDPFYWAAFVMME